MCWACGRSWATSRALAETWPRPIIVFTPAANKNCAGLTCVARRHTAIVPSRVNFQLTNPDGTCVPRDPTNPQDNQCIQVPLPIYGIASIGGRYGPDRPTQSTASRSSALSCSRFFDDFGIDVATSHGQLTQSPEGFATLTAPLYGCPVYNNGSCQGGIPGTEVGFRKIFARVAGTNFVPRMSTGAELW